MKTKKCYVAMNLDTNLKTLHLKAGSSIDPITRLQQYENSNHNGTNFDGAVYISGFLCASNLIKVKQFTNFHRQEQRYINTLRAFKNNNKEALKKNWQIDIALHHAKEEDMRGTPYPSETGIDQELYDMLVKQTIDRIVSAEEVWGREVRKRKYEDRLNSLDSKDPIKPQIQKALKQERKALKESKELLNQLNLKHYNRRMPQSQQFIERYPKRGLKIYRSIQSTRKQIHELKNS
jgi:hypothetical protein